MIEEEGLQANAKRVGDIFLKGMMELRDEFEIVGDVRGKGLMLGMELVEDKVRADRPHPQGATPTNGCGYMNYSASALSFPRSCCASISASLQSSKRRLQPERMATLFELTKDSGVLFGKSSQGNVSQPHHTLFPSNFHTTGLAHMHMAHTSSFADTPFLLQTLRIKPALCVTEEDAKFALHVLRTSLRQCS